MKACRMIFVTVFMVLITIVSFSVQDVFCWGLSLKSQVQDEIDKNPFLKKDGIKLRVIAEKDGYLTVEMYEGNKKVRKAIHDYGWPMSELQKDYDMGGGDLQCVKTLQLSIETLQKIKDVKSIKLTSTINTPRDKADDLLSDALNSYKENKNPTDYLKKITDAIQFDPSYARGFGMRGSYYDTSGNIQLAINDYSKAIELNPNATVYLMLARAYYKLGDYKQSINNYEKAMELNPQYASKCYYNIGCDYALEGNSSMACATLRKAFELGLKKETAMSDKDFDKIRKEPCFQELIAK